MTDRHDRLLAVIWVLLIIFGMCWMALSPPAKAGERRILVVGDSISLGAMPYMPACVRHAPGNSRDSGYVLEHLDEWIDLGYSDGQSGGPPDGWDGYIVGAGLWDIAHLAPTKTNPYALGSVTDFPVTAKGWDYYANVDAILTRLAQTGKPVAWTTMTDVPPGSLGRRAGDVEPYNNIAVTIARWGHRVAINDVYAAMLPHADLHVEQAVPGGVNKVHYNAAGYRLVAQVYIDTIERTIGGC